MTSAPALPSTGELRDRLAQRLLELGAGTVESGDLPVRSPITGTVLTHLRASTELDVMYAIDKAHNAFRSWRTVPAPRRAAVVRRLGQLLTDDNDALAEMVTLEAGKIGAEARGEVQEMIDVCEFAVGLSRQLYGRTMASERAGHRLMETWHPLGVVGRDLGLQLPGRGVVVEYRDRAGLRRYRGVEASQTTPSPHWPVIRCCAGPPPMSGWIRRSISWSRVGPRSADCSSTTNGSRCSAPPARYGWAARWHRGSPRASAGACSSWAVTTAPWSPNPLISNSPRALSFSRRRAPPGSAAPHCGG